MRIYMGRYQSQKKIKKKLEQKQQLLLRSRSMMRGKTILRIKMSVQEVNVSSSI